MLGDLELTATQRRVLLAPGAVARLAASTRPEPEEQWLLRQPAAVRRAFVHEVVDEGRGLRLAMERWMLRQPDAVREQYLREVVEPRLALALRSGDAAGEP